MEILVWIMITFSMSLFLRETAGKKERMIYTILGCVSGAAVSFFLRFAVHVNHISLWLALSYVFIAVQANYTLRLSILEKGKRKEAAVLALKTMAGGLILVVFFYNLAIGNIGAGAGTDNLPPVTAMRATCMILAGTLLWLYGGRAAIRFPNTARVVLAAILAVSPAILFLTAELCWNSALMEMNFSKIMINVIIYALLEVFAVNLWQKRMRGLTLLYVLIWIAGTANHFVLQFRGQPIIAADIFAAETAFSVAAGYTYKMDNGMSMSFLIVYFMAALTGAAAVRADALECPGCFQWKVAGRTFSLKRSVIRRCVCCLAAAGILTGWINSCDFAEKYHIVINFWEQKQTYQSAGIAPGFITYLQKMKVKAPEGYSSEKVNAILDPYMDKKTAESSTASQVKPTIIAIMNESFSDLSVLGPLECVDEQLSFLRSLKNDPNIVEYGWNYVSTLGGGTSTTEFEFLTGNSISNTNGINPYADFRFDNVPNMAWQLKEQGYKTIALHPEAPANWRRNSVYPAMGFDEFLSMDYFKDAERTVWNRVSDLGNYKKLIEVYEKQTGPAFLFNVTMQNHGGYEIDAIEENKKVSVDDEYSQYTDFQAYQSLINESDKGLQYLIHYFETADKPVIICFFGDHQPWLNNEFEDRLRAAGRTELDTDLSVEEKSYTVPYFIWSNFKTEEDLAIQNTDGIDIVSTNYLGTLVQKYAGLELSSYDAYRMEQRADMPVLNFCGYYTAEHEWHYIGENTKYQPWLNRYALIQYNALFDRRKDMRYYLP